MKNKIIFPVTVAALILFAAISCRKNETAQTIALPGNLLPVATAGPDQTITLPLDSVVLDGSNSFDLNDKIISYRWRAVSTAFATNISNDTSSVTTVHFTYAGNYYFELTVKDSLNTLGRDTCKVVVLPNLSTSDIFSLSVSVFPYDTLLNLPINTITLNSQAYLNGPGNQPPPAPVLKIIEWKKLAGPDNFYFLSPDKLINTINNLTAGMYAFECKVTDAANRKASMSTVIRVSDPVAPEQELVIQNLLWIESNGFWAPATEVNLNSIIALNNKCIKKVFVKTDCATSFIEAQPGWRMQDPPEPHYYSIYYYDNQLRLSIENWSQCQNGTVDIKIIYS